LVPFSEESYDTISLLFREHYWYPAGKAARARS
jgi:hypothetical protein